jgi:hypothetical protein
MMATVVDSPIGYDQAWFVGEDKLLTVTCYIEGTTQAEVDAGTATPQDLTGWTIAWALRKSRYATTIMLSKAMGAIVILAQTGSTLGQFTVAIARADTTTPTEFKAGTYFHGAARINTGAYDVIAEGPAVLRKAAIR